MPDRSRLQSPVRALPGCEMPMRASVTETGIPEPEPVT